MNEYKQSADELFSTFSILDPMVSSDPSTSEPLEGTFLSRRYISTLEKEGSHISTRSS
jgi:hypothetical protein